jgi:uncharacterized peroxidase-related enzyme
MTRFTSRSDKANVPDILRMSPEAGKALIEMHEAIMRGPSPLTAGERELISAYVSGLNKCRYCYGVHSEAAKSYDEIPNDAVDRMMSDLETAGFDDRLIPILRFAGKLTVTPAGMTDADAQAVFDAGWDEQALHDATMVVCCFNFMNRLLEAHHVHGNEALFRERGPMLKQYGYLPLIRLLTK